MKKWKEYLAEIILIILGINLGLWVNNLNENNKERGLEKKLLIELQSDLKQDLADIQSNIEVHQEAGRKNDLALDYIKNAVPETDLDSILKVAQDCRDWTFLVSKTSTYESLKSIGFQIIKNDQLRRQITDLHNVSYKFISEYERLHQRDRALLEEKIEALYGLRTSLQQQQQHPPELKKQITELQVNILRMMWSNQRLEKTYKEQVEPNIQALMTLLAKELE